MNILTHLIRRPSHVQLGTFYRIVGHTPRHTQIPPQVWQPQRKAISPLTGTGLFFGPLYMRIGSSIYRLASHPIPFDDIGISPHSDEFHDMHLECGPDNSSTVYQALGTLQGCPELRKARHATFFA